jgi:primosomal protein N' (replication factor Y)
MAIAKVEPLTTARALRGPFDYRIPREMAGVGVGSLLVVPFGRRRIHGLVVDVVPTSELPTDRLVEPLECLEAGVPEELVALGLWVADRYCSTPARGLSLVLPPGTGTAGTAPGARARELLEAELTGEGLRVLRVADARLGPRQHAALEALAGGPLLVADLTARTRIGHGALKSLATRGFVRLCPRAIARRPAAVERGGPVIRAKLPTLTAAQGAALEAVTAPLRERRHERLLLHGVTGSGKTEIYLRAASLALELGRSAIVLVPEIALTPQTARRFEERFGARVAVLHSKLGIGERFDEWQRLRSGEARVCVGPRSAVFAPLRDVGLIVVDEEHDSAYKQEGDPRYDARRVAERRAERAGAVLLCGSATPRPESWLEMRRLELPERIGGRPLPPVELLDMRGLRHALHPDSRAALEEVKRRQAKAIVLVNRRGWAPFLVCRSCGHAWSCARCDVTLTLHRDDGEAALRCHHCAHREDVPRACPSCHSITIARHGTGTQRLEAELREALDPLPVFRLDADAGARKHGVASVLEQFAAASAGILVGTQMVAQGHDFPEVELAVVQDADSTLRFPDFRAEERTFSLVAQLAGRSGRGPGGGRVLVQTLAPETSCLQHARDHDAALFLKAEIERRRALSYPPFSRLARVVTSALEQAPADRAAAYVRDLLEGSSGELLGPAPLFRVKDRFRSVLLLKLDTGRGSVRPLAEAVQRASSDKAHRGVAFSVDVDPQ